jgi:outer membrane lipoprotein carrier protein
MMMRRWGIVVGVLLLARLLSPANDRGEDVLEKVKEKYDAMRDARVTFSQKTTFELSNVEHAVTGILYMKKENKYRVELDDQTIVTDGETVWKYSPIQRQVLVDRFKADGRTFSPERVLGGAPSGFTPTVLGTERVDKSETIVLKLTARDEDSFVRSMKLWVDDATWLIKKAEYIDAGGTRTEYLVSDFKIDTGLDDARFRYQIPEGVDVVDLR